MKKTYFIGLSIFVLGVCFFINTVTLFAAEVTLSWNPPIKNEDGTIIDDLAGHIVYSGNAPGSYSQSIDVGNVAFYELDNLTAGQTYYFAVAAYDISANESEHSNEVSKYVELIDTTSPYISGIYADNINSNSATINWTTNEAADTQVEYGTTLSYGNTSSLDSSLVTVHSQTINVAPSTQYYYRVLSSDASGNLAVSVDHTFISGELADLTPPVISNVQVTNIAPSSVTITWMTDEASTSKVQYGFYTNYENYTATDSNLVTIHSVDILGLSS